MSKQNLFILCILFISSCATEGNSENPEEKMVDSIRTTNQPDTLSQETSSSYSVGEYEIQFEEITSEDCDGLELMIPPKESDFIDADSSVVRIDDKLIFTLNTGDTIILKNRPFDEEQQNFNSTASYSFFGSVDRLNHWEVFAIGYECHYTVLINKNNGRQTTVIGRPVASPNSQLVICGNPDLESRYTINGFDILKYENDALVEVGQFEIPDWGPYEARWKNDSVAIIKKGVLGKDFDIVKSCVEMTFIENGG